MRAYAALCTCGPGPGPGQQPPAPPCAPGLSTPPSSSSPLPLSAHLQLHFFSCLFLHALSLPSPDTSVTWLCLPPAHVLSLHPHCSLHLSLSVSLPDSPGPARAHPAHPASLTSPSTPCTLMGCTRPGARTEAVCQSLKEVGDHQIHAPHCTDGETEAQRGRGLGQVSPGSRGRILTGSSLHSIPPCLYSTLTSTQQRQGPTLYTEHRRPRSHPTCLGPTPGSPTRLPLRPFLAAPG